MNMASLKLYVLDLGRIRMDKSLMIARSNLATSSNPNRPAETIELPIMAFYIDHPDGRVLFDTGCNPNSMGPNGRWPQSMQETFPYIGGEECQLPNRLEQLGIGPGDIPYVVVSHLHMDHSGCLEFFRKSTIFVHDDEFSGALKSYAMNQDAFVRADINAWIQNELHWHLVQKDEGDFSLLEGIKILNFGSGHSFGMLGLQVNLPHTGSSILASDALYCKQNYEPPILMPGICHDTLGYRRTALRIRQLALETRSRVLFGHDSEQFATLIKSTDGYYD